jgi:DNA-directed RNA polymerase specialized sigma24 family protein
MMSRNFTPEQTLIDKLLFDDTAAFEELSRRYCYSLYSYCMHKLNSAEDARRIVRNIFIALWEDRYLLPVNFSLSVYLYTEVRKAVIQCISNKLNSNRDIPAIEKQIIPGFAAVELQKAKQPVKSIYNQVSNYQSSVVKRSYEEPWWNKYSSAISVKSLKHVLQNMVNMW